MTRTARCSLLVMLLLLLGVRPAAAQGLDSRGVLTVEVFANSAMLITPHQDHELPYRLNVYRIDGLHSIEDALNQQLPQTEDEARQWMQQHQNEILERYREQIASAAQGLSLMMRYRINRVPAIVINQRVVVYGMTSVSAAIARARDHLGNEQL